MKISFLGAAREVTGSMHLLQLHDKNILLDCGLFQGNKRDAEKKNKEFLIDPATVDFIILSHAHIDHSGNIPRFYKNGFRGKIFCTPATKDLCELMLVDSAYIQEKEAEFYNTKHPSKPVEPLYTREDAIEAMALFVEIPFYNATEIAEGFTVEFLEAGHILGSAFTRIFFKDEDNKNKILFYTGDMGRRFLPILMNPYQIDTANIVITESTYGNRMHDEVESIEKDITDIITKAVVMSGKIIIPAFSVERTQEMIYILHKLRNKKKIPRIPIYVDSPLATNVTAVFGRHMEEYDKETFQDFIDNKESPFGFSGLTYTESQEESRQLNSAPGPIIIISASGMCDHGRVKHHIRNTIDDESNTILLVGFMAEGTLGRKLADKEMIITIFGRRYLRKATVKIINALSGHADQKELIEYLSNIKEVSQMFLVHGEYTAQQVLKEYLTEGQVADKIIIPKRGTTYEIE